MRRAPIGHTIVQCLKYLKRQGSSIMPVPQKPRKLSSTLRPGATCCKKFAKFMFSHVGLFIIVSMYAVGGAYLFMYLENEAEELRHENRKNVSLELHDAKQYLSKLLWDNNVKNHTKQSYDRLVLKNLEHLRDFIVDKASDSSIKYDGTHGPWDYDWNFSKSLLFTFTSMAAIGYGHISPKTFYGRIVTVIYNIIGVPLLLLFLANIGFFLANSFKYIYSRLICRCCRIRRKLNELASGTSLEKKVLWKERIGAEDFMPTDEMTVPITVNLVLIFIYLCIGGLIFSSWEGWDLVSSIYFCFITLTTIGFGDMVPGNSFLASAATMMIVNVFYVLIGMALVAMCINLMQDQIIQKCHWFAIQVGITEIEEDPILKYKIKLGKTKYTKETPPGCDGNKRRKSTESGHLMMSNIYE